MKLLTFIIPLYNREETIGATLASVSALESSLVEIIVVDDGSNDGSRKIVEQEIQKYGNITLFNRSDFKDEKGASVSRNVGLSKATTPYVHFLDSDDLVGSDTLDIFQNALKKNAQLDFYVFQTEIFKDVIGDLNQYQTHMINRNIIDRFVDEKSVWQNLGPIWRRSSLEQIKGYTEAYTSFQDWDLMMRALLNDFTFDFFQLHHPIWFYRQTTGDTISKRRFDYDHIVSNYTMINNLYALMLERGKNTEQRRKYFAQFATQVLLRCLFDPKAISEQLIFDLLSRSSATVLRHDEVEVIQKEYKKRTTVLYNWFQSYRNWRKAKVKKGNYGYLFDKKMIDNA